MIPTHALDGARHDNDGPPPRFLGERVHERDPVRDHDLPLTAEFDSSLHYLRPPPSIQRGDPVVEDDAGAGCVEFDLREESGQTSKSP